MSAQTPWLSVIVPALDEAPGIADCLAPLQAWRERGVEILLVDGGSRDTTTDIARSLVDAVLIDAPGRARQMNRGASAARAPLLWFLHADSRPDPSLPLCLQALPESVEWGRFDVALRGRHPGLAMVAWFMNWRSALTGIATGDQGLFVRAVTFHQLGGFDALPLMEDVALSRRLRARAWPRRIRRRLLADGRRWDEHGLWHTIRLMWWLRLRFALGADPVRLYREYYPGREYVE